MIRRTVDVGDNEGEVRQGAVERDCKGVNFCGVAGVAPGTWIPGSDDSSP